MITFTDYRLKKSDIEEIVVTENIIRSSNATSEFDFSELTEEERNNLADFLEYLMEK